MQACASVLIVAKASRRREGLQALLASTSWLKIVGQANDAPAALMMAADHHPNLVLLDVDLPENDAWSVLKKIRAEWPQIRCIVLTDSIQQQRAAEIAGADAALLKGFPTSELLEAIGRVLPVSTGAEM